MTHITTTNSARAGRGSRFFRESRGASAVAFSLAAPVALLGIAGVISYLNALQYQQQVQLAADSAALAAAQALNLDAHANVQQIAQNYFNANAPAGAVNNPALNVIGGSDASGNNTVEINYSGSTKALFAFSGSGSSVPVSTHSFAHSALGSNSSGNRTPGGSGGSGGTSGPCVGAGCYLFETAFQGALGNYYTSFFSQNPSAPDPLGGPFQATGLFQNPVTWNPLQTTQCASPSGSWYNMLSDAGIQINVTCGASAYYNGGSIITGVNVMLNIDGATHVVNVSQSGPLPPSSGKMNVYPAAPNFVAPANQWLGGVTIDGVYYAPPSGCTYDAQIGGSMSPGAPCWPTYLKGTVGVYVSTMTNSAADAAVLKNYNQYADGFSEIVIQYPGYYVTIGGGETGLA